MGYVISVIVSVVAGVMVFIIQSLLKDNKRLREGRKEENIKKEAALQNGLVCLLRIQLIEYHSKYMELDGIPSYAYENFELAYKAYKALGGNGMIEHMWEDIQELQISRR